MAGYRIWGPGETGGIIGAIIYQGWTSIFDLA